MQINSFSDHFAPPNEFIHILPKSPRLGQFKVVRVLGKTTITADEKWNLLK